MELELCSRFKVGAKIDKDNIRKIIKNDSSDPGKPMNLNYGI